MPLEFDSEEDFQAALQQQSSTGPLSFESEEDFQSSLEPQSTLQTQQLPQNAISGQQNVVESPQQDIPQQGSFAPQDLASLVLGKNIPQPQAENKISRKSIVESYGSQNNTLYQKIPPGLEEFHPADMQAVTEALAASFMSMSSTGIVLDPMERVMYASSVMENTSVRSDIRAQLVDQAMRDGKILPQALPKAWYEARGLILLPPDLNLSALEGELE